MKMSLMRISYAFTIVCVASCSNGSMDSMESTLVRDFLTNKADLCVIVEMFNQDQDIGVVASDYVQPDDIELGKITSQRIERYRELMRKCRLSGSIRRRSPDRVMLGHSNFGLSISGASYGYLYSTTEPEGIVTDSFADLRPRESATFHKKLKGHENWYIFYDYED